MIVSTNPTTDVELARYTPQSPQEVNDILDAAASAQAAWRRRDITDRTSLLREMARVLRDGRDTYAALITAEMGKPITEARTEIEKCATTCEYYAEHAPAQLADRPVTSNATESAVVYDPLGVVLAVMPWNYPFWQFFRFAAPALAAGNGTLLKHANNVPQCALAVEEIVRKAGAPGGLCRTLLIKVDQVAGLIADPRVAAVTLTGSTEVGAIVASRAAAVLKKQVLELGGSDPFVVLADADIAQAAATAVKARYVNAKRFIVEEAVADEFAAAFTAAAAALKVGDPTDPDTAIGPMARANLRDTLHDQVRRTVDAGAVLVLGGKVPDGPGCYYPPTVLDHVRPGMAAFDEETFGPVAAITRVTSADDAITLANQTEYGLGAALWTSDLDRAQRFARVLDAGAVFINGMVASDPRLPFGGIKRSGYGRELGAEGIREFVNTKTVWIGPAAPTA
ncbi:NAD-dependent succinate-semialdehyde dehydrogenase [Streptomyces sp. Cmuel-A718b]|uniref:NAD-dependent succinate-semialdehyde dehydrogenase n=1 Tax=Streptomyces sp. Cmuel-A718b TaxID=697328 RepID=UPI00081DCD7F|nr:NAD-dependent succinate-semialdehyde dehydrogenase [Streptomyces sp. Cmuel-A718b]SCF58991.1 succinate-semialdehyde dehydrogenase / glutarate-semialdehyde dehydrogenase [Streptomyces sp. Cmuel-A718b]